MSGDTGLDLQTSARCLETLAWICRHQPAVWIQRSGSTDGGLMSGDTGLDPRTSCRRPLLVVVVVKDVLEVVAHLVEVARLELALVEDLADRVELPTTFLGQLRVSDAEPVAPEDVAEEAPGLRQAEKGGVVGDCSEPASFDPLAEVEVERIELPGVLRQAIGFRGELGWGFPL